MNEEIKPLIVPGEIIMNQIYFIRGYKVMLDEDLAELYQVTTGNLNKAVARNIKRFPYAFMFRLTDEEFENLLFHFGRASWGPKPLLDGLVIVSLILIPRP